MPDPTTDYPGLPSEGGPTVEFDYSVWTPDTIVTLTNVPWDSEYRDVVNWTDSDSRRAWFDAQEGVSVTIKGLTYLRYGEPVRVALPFSQCNYFNYLRVSNPLQPVPSRYSWPSRRPDEFYYFILDVSYLAPNTTELTIQLDVWTTYADRVEMLPSYLSRGHAGMANENCSRLEDYRVYLTEPEGFNLGSDYDTYACHYQNWQGEEPVFVVQTSIEFQNADWGTLDAPKMHMAVGGYPAGVPSAASLYVFSQDSFTFFRIAMADYPWVAQGIQAVYAIPRPFVDTDNLTEFHISPQGQDITFWAVSPHPIERVYEIVNRNQFSEYFGIPAPYNRLKKFYTAPYTYLTFENGSGAVLQAKPELMNFRRSDDGSHEAAAYTLFSAIAPPSPRACIVPWHYNQDEDYDYERIEMEYDYYTPGGNRRHAYLPWGDWFNFALTWDNFPQYAIYSDSYALYMAQNAHSLKWSQEAADWSQEKALRANATSYDQAGVQMELAARMTDIGLGASAQNLALQHQQLTFEQDMRRQDQIAGLVSTGLELGNIYGLITDSLQRNPQQHALLDQQNAIDTATTRAQTSAQLGAAAYNRDTNRSLADWSAKGDYANTIAGIQAKVQDAKLTPPSIVGQNGGEAFSQIFGFAILRVRWRRPYPHAIRQIGDYWFRYGYAVNRFIQEIKSLSIMTHFSYWQFTYANFNATMPEQFKGTIRGILEKGVTVWERADEVNQVSIYDNEPKGGFSYE